MRYGMTTDYDYNETHKRDKINIWSGAWSSDYEGEALSVKGGYMVTPYYGDKFRVQCPTPRTDANFIEVDAAIEAAMQAHAAARTSASA